MTDHPSLELDAAVSSGAPSLVCPDCSGRLSAESLSCENCGTRALERDGVLSFRTKGEAPAGRSDPGIAEFARTVTNRSLRDAATSLAGTDRQSDVLAVVFDVQREVWQPLVAAHLTGRCLDLFAGSGRRSMVLAERADSVAAVDPSLDRLQIAAERDDYDSSGRVRPIHGSDDRLPFPEGAFDTIVADFTGRTVSRSRLDRLGRYLADDGSALFLADGWPRSTGLTDLLGIEDGTWNADGGVTPATAEGYRSLATAAGFDEVSVYALFPTASRPLYAFDVENEFAIPWIFEMYANEHGRLGRSVETVMGFLNERSLLKRCYPSVLVVCSNKPKPSTFGFTHPLAVAGRTRSIVLDLGPDGVDTIHKVPNRRAHEPFTARENRVTAELGSAEAPVASTIPTGTSVDSPFGSVRRVTPAAGRPLDEEVGGDAASMERTLRIGYGWLIDFQRAFGGDTMEQSPSEVRTELQFEPAAVDPPEIGEPVRTFSTPVHGDFMSSNIYYDGTEITSVIDWEYGALNGSPVADAGYLLLNTAAWLVGDFEERVRAILCGDTEYAERARSCVRRYCDAVGLPYRTFELSLPLAYLHQLRLDWQLDSVSTYTSRMDEQVRRVTVLFDAVDDMKISSDS